MNLKAYCAGLVRKARTNFYWAFVFLPKEKREAIFAAYAFSRHTDDIVDEAASPETARREIDAWRQELHACYDGAPTHPIAQNLQRVLQRFDIPRDHFLALIDGVEMDLHQNRYATFDELYPYCYRVASAVGLICIEIFGYTNPQTRVYAENLGIALQLTNILRDVVKDCEQNRIYLPTEDLDRFGYTDRDMASRRYNDAFVNLMQFECNRAREYYRRAAATLPAEDRSRMFSAEIMGRIYGRLLDQIEAAHYNIFDAAIGLGNARKCAIALTYWLGSRFASGRT